MVDYYQLINFNLGMMAENMKVNEIKIKCMEKVFLHGRMEEFIMENIIWIKKKDMVYFIGLMAENIEEIGKMENKMVKVFILAKIKLIKFEFGFLIYFHYWLILRIMEREKNGLMRINEKIKWIFF